MYDELVKRLRCQRFGNCPNCPMWYTEEVEPNLWRERCAAIDAADAIEELSAINQRQLLEIAVLSKPKWIPVTERLPEKNQIVVVVQHGKTWDYGQFRGLAYLGGNIHKWNWKNNTPKTVDYWMPKKSALPEPPKEE